MHNHYHLLILEHFIISKRTPVPQSSHFSFLPSPSPSQPLTCFLSIWIYLFWRFHISGIIYYIVCCVRLLSLSIKFSRLIHVVASTSMPSILMAAYYSTVQINHILSIHSPPARNLNCGPGLSRPEYILLCLSKRNRPLLIQQPVSPPDTQSRREHFTQG